MKFNILCIGLLALLTGAGAASASGMSLLNSVDLMGGAGGFSAFSEEYVNSLFGIGTEASETWFGPEFDNTSSASSFLSEFLINTTTLATGGFVPVKIDISHQTPGKIYFGSGQEITYTQYQSTISSPSRSNELWIQKGMDWSQYAIVPVKSAVQLLAFSPAGGQADYYEIYQSDSMGITSRSLTFFSGYSSVSFAPQKAGRYVLLFVLNNQPSNAVIVDVISEAPPVQQSASASDMPPASNNPAGSGFGPGAAAGAAVTSTTTTSTTTSTTGVSGTATITQTQQSQGYGPSSPSQGTATPAATGGDTPVTIQSQGMRGYQVFLDGVYIGTEGTSGDALDGKFSFRVVGGQSHSVRVFDGQFNYPKSMFFPKGVLKIINVEPGTAVYI